jgi:hypothetical protein
MPQMNQPKFYRNLILGFPIGIVLLGGGSLAYHFAQGKGVKKEAPQKGRGEMQAYRSYQRKAINEEDLRLFVERLAGNIGARCTTQPKGVRETLSFIEGLLGPNNIGYNTVVRNAPQTSSGPTQLEVEIPGVRRPGEVVLVTASYYSPALSPGAHRNASGVAALISLAQSLVGTEPERTLKMVFLPHEIAPPTESQPLVDLAKNLKLEPVNCKLHLHLYALGYAPQTQLPNQSTLAILQNAAAEPHASFRSNFAQSSALTLAPDTAPAADGKLILETLQRVGFPAVLVTDSANAGTPTLDTPEQINIPVLTEITRSLARSLEPFLYPSKAGKL